MNLQEHLEIFSGIAGSASHAYHRPGKTFTGSVLKFAFGAISTYFLSPGVSSAMGAQDQHTRAVVSFLTGLVGPLLLSALVNVVDRRRHALAEKLVDKVAGKDDEPAPNPEQPNNNA